jgi:hypothetical protein
METSALRPSTPGAVKLAARIGEAGPAVQPLGAVHESGPADAASTGIMAAVSLGTRSTVIWSERQPDKEINPTVAMRSERLHIMLLGRF